MALTRELNGLDGGQVDELELFSFGETEGGKVACGPLDSLGCLQAHGRIVDREIMAVISRSTIQGSVGTWRRIVTVVAVASDSDPSSFLKQLSDTRASDVINLEALEKL